MEWRFLLTGGVALENPFPNPAHGWLTEKSWAEIVRASDLPALKGFMDHFRMNVRTSGILSITRKGLPRWLSGLKKCHCLLLFIV